VKPTSDDLDAHRAAIIDRDRCHYIVHEGERMLMPGCMGAAVYGPDGCTCGDPPGGIAELRALVERLSDQVGALQRGAVERQKEVWKLRDRLARLEKFMRPSE
jgi:hypothetical protein